VDLKEHLKNITDTGTCPELKKLILYHKGQLSGRELFEVENHLAGCDICTDLLEGFSLLTNNKSLKLAENDLRKRLDNYLFPRKFINIFFNSSKRLLAAATILFLTGMGFYLYLLLKPSDSLVAKLNEPVKLKSQKTFSISHVEDAKKNKLSVTVNQPLNNSDGKEKTSTVILKQLLLIQEYKPKATKNNLVVEENSSVQPTISTSDIEMVNINDSNIKASEAVALNEVVVVGYGTQKKSDISGSVVSISKEDKKPLNGAPQNLKLLSFDNAGIEKEKNKLTSNRNSPSTSSKNLSNDSAIIVAELNSLIQAIQVDPKNKEKVKQLAEKYIELKDPNKSVEILNELSKLYSDTTKIKDITDIIALVKIGRFNKSLKKLKSLKL